MATTEKNDKGAYMTLGMIFGTVVGMGAGMLLAPSSGKETRDKIKSKAMTARDTAKEQLTQKRDMAKEKLNKSLDKSKDMINKTADKTKEVVDNASERAQDAAAQARMDTHRPNSAAM